MRPRKLLKLFSNNYTTIENDGGFCLYDRYCKRGNAKFLGKFYISTDGKKFVFNEEEYDTVESLVKAMDDYYSTMPFDSEIYNPLYRKNFRVEMALHDYLLSLGFKMSWDSRLSCYYLEDVYSQKICEVSFDVKDDTTVGVVTKYILADDNSKNRSIKVPFDSLDSAIGAVNSILGTYCLALNAQMIKLLDSLTSSRATTMLDVTFNLTELKQTVDDAKANMIKHLEEELEKLKGS